MTMISPFDTKTPRQSAGDHSASDYTAKPQGAGSDRLTELARIAFNQAYMICALPVSLVQWPFALRRKRLTGQRQSFWIRSPYDSTGFAIEPPQTATRTERLVYLAKTLEAENAQANRQTIHELEDLIRDLRADGSP